MFQTHPVLLKNLLDNVESAKIQLPDFQRGWVWEDDRIRGLLSSISRMFPIGAVMTLSAGGDIRFKTRTIEGVEPIANGQAESFLLDGQQRLTSLYQALRHPDPVNTHDSRGRRIKRRYYINMLAALDDNTDREEAFLSVQEDRKETADFGRKVVLDLSSPELEYQQHMMPTERFLNPMQWAMAYIRHWHRPENQHPMGDPDEFFDKFNEKVLQNFDKYQLPVINLEKETPKEAVCTVFEKVNMGGVALTVFELVTASFAAETDVFSLRDDWELRRKRMYSFSGTLQGVAGDHFLQAISLLKTQEDRRRAIRQGTQENQAPGIGCKKQHVLDLKLEDYHQWADQVEEGFIETAKFLQSQHIFKQKDVPYTTQMVPLAAIHVELGKEAKTAIANSRLEHWYWSGIFGEMYGGNTETQYTLDIAQVARYVRDGTPPTLVNQANFIAARLLTLRSRNSAAYKGLYALLMKNGASDWITGDPISIVNYHDENIDIHHIFPQAWCIRATPRIPDSIYNSVINKTPIDAHTNREIGGQAPSRYLPRLRRSMKPEMLKEVLQKHWIELEALEQDDFVGEFIRRGQAMMDMVGTAIEKDLDRGRATFERALRQAGLMPAGTEADSIPYQAEEFDEDVDYDEFGDTAYEAVA